MKQEVLITLRGTQTFAQEKPESIELMTRGTMTGRNGKFAISYEETELTGVKGTTTTFLVFNPKRIVLSLRGPSVPAWFLKKESKMKPSMIWASAAC